MIMDDIFDNIPDDAETVLYNSWYNYINKNIENKKSRIIWKRAMMWVMEQPIKDLISENYIEFDFNDGVVNVSLNSSLFEKFEDKYK
jgi:hypothetical protein